MLIINTKKKPNKFILVGKTTSATENIQKYLLSTKSINVSVIKIEDALAVRKQNRENTFIIYVKLSAMDFWDRLMNTDTSNEKNFNLFNEEMYEFSFTEIEEKANCIIDDDNTSNIGELSSQVFSFIRSKGYEVVVKECVYGKI